MPIASLPWYDLPEIRWARDALWSAISRELRQQGWRAVPESLEASEQYEEHWACNGLLLSQACGYDVLFGHAERLQIVATPCFSAPGCEGPMYSSHIVVRERRHASAARGARRAISGPARRATATA